MVSGDFAGLGVVLRCFGWFPSETGRFGAFLSGFVVVSGASAGFGWSLLLVSTVIECILILISFYDIWLRLGLAEYEQNYYPYQITYLYIVLILGMK